MPEQGLSPEQQQLGQLGQLGLGPGASPPGLLQMSQEPLFLDPMFAGPGGSYNEQNYVAQVLANAARSQNANTALQEPSQAQFGTWGSSDLAGRAGASGQQFAHSADMNQYFDASGQPRADDPRKVAADAGINIQQLVGGIAPRYGSRYGRQTQGYDFPSDKGGFFKTEDLYRNNPRGVPQSQTFGQGGLSTNNWRLLGMGPGWIMRNNFLIDTQSGGAGMGGPAGWVPSGGNSGEQSMPGRATALGAGTAYGVPNMLQSGMGQPLTFGWPGATQWFHDPGATPDAGMGG
jgi:hypothetical protein